MEYVSLRVTPDASQLCAISLDYRRVSMSTGISMDWGSLAVGPCILISQSNAYCYSVPSYGYLVVGLGIIQTTAASNGRRRLLQEADVHGMTLEQEVYSFGAWNHTASPCNHLAQHAGNLTSFMDRYQLEQCVLRRRIGRNILRRLNVSSFTLEKKDTFLLSLTDFAFTVSKNSELLYDLGSKVPQLLVILAEESGLTALLARVYRAFTASAWAKVWASSFSLGNNLTEINRTQSLPLPLRDAFFMGGLEGEAFSFLESHLLAVDHARAAEMADLLFYDMNEGSRNTTQLLLDQNNNNSEASRSRRLLQSDDDTRFIKTYSAWVASTKGFSNIQIGKSKLTDSWLEGPLQWPPRYTPLSFLCCCV